MNCVCVCVNVCVFNDPPTCRWVIELYNHPSTCRYSYRFLPVSAHFSSVCSPVLHPRRSPTCCRFPPLSHTDANASIKIKNFNNLQSDEKHDTTRTLIAPQPERSSKSCRRSDRSIVSAIYRTNRCYRFKTIQSSRMTSRTALFLATAGDSSNKKRKRGSWNPLQF